MSVQITSAMPWMYSEGIHDYSPAQPVLPRTESPDHCPIAYIVAERGPIAREKVATYVDSGGQRINMFGSSTFDETGKYASHQTCLSNRLMKSANAHFISRLWPDDGGPKATVRLNMHVLFEEFPVNRRNSDGSFARSALGELIPLDGTTVKGATVMFTTSVIPTTSDGGSGIGLGTISNVSPLGEGALVYPIYDKEVTWFGSYGNNQGFGIYTNTTKTQEAINTDMVTATRAFPFRMSIVERDDAYSTGRRKQTISGEYALDFNLRPNSFYKRLNKELYLGNCFKTAWSIQGTAGTQPVYGPFGRIAIYQENIDFLLGKFYDLEKEAQTPWTDIDFNLDPDVEKYMFNLFGGHTTQGIPYVTYRFASITASPDAVSLTENNYMYAGGAHDGTITSQTHERLAIAEMRRFTDNQEEITWNLARYPITDVYDTGYALEGKEAVIECLSHRQQLFVHLTTHTVGARPLSASEESSLGAYLYTRIGGFPESTFHNTAACRGMIMARSGQYLDGTFRQDLPLLFEQIKNTSAVCGASSGVWATNRINDIYAENVITSFGDLNVDNVPPLTMAALWSKGIIYPLDYDMNKRQIGALQTVFPDDSSVLNNYWVVRAGMALFMVGHLIWRKFRGSSKMDRAELAQAVEEEFDALVVSTNKFGSLINTTRECKFTKEDIKRNYSWTLIVRMGGKSQKNVQTFALSSYTYEDLQSIIASGQ